MVYLRANPDAGWICNRYDVNIKSKSEIIILWINLGTNKIHSPRKAQTSKNKPGGISINKIAIVAENFCRIEAKLESNAPSSGVFFSFNSPIDDSDLVY